MTKDNNTINTKESIALIRSLADILEKTELTEIDYKLSNLHVRLASQSPVNENLLKALQNISLAPAAPQLAPQPAPQALPPASSEPTPAAPSPENHPGVVISPMVGVVYTQPDADSPPFVTIGTSVKQGDVLILVEAMKVFNSIKAHKDGKVTQIFVTDGQAVEFGEPLMVIE